MTRPHIHLTPMHQHVAETRHTFLLAIIFIGGILLAAGAAYQAVQVDRQIGWSIN